jgi:chromosome segregation ATPase
MEGMMSERLARIVSTTADELLQAHKKIEAFEYGIELAEKHQCELNTKVISLTDQLTAAQSEVERLKEDQFNSHEKIMIFFEGIDRGNDVRGVSLIDKVSALIDLAKYTHSTIKALTTEANSYREQYDELREELGYLKSHTHKEVLYGEKMISEYIGKFYITSERELHNTITYWKNKYRRLVAQINRCEKESYKVSDGYSVCDILPLHALSEKAYKERVGKRC